MLFEGVIGMQYMLYKGAIVVSRVTYSGDIPQVSTVRVFGIFDLQGFQICKCMYIYTCEGLKKAMKLCISDAELH